MNKQNRNYGLRIVLSCVLVVLVGALGVFLVFNYFASKNQVTIETPDNHIEHCSPNPKKDSQSNKKSEKKRSQTDDNSFAFSSEENTTGDDYSGKSYSIDLYKNHPRENNAFYCANMFPGDKETHFYNIKITFHGTIDVHYKVTLDDEYNKLADNLRVRVVSTKSGNAIYDGLIHNMDDIYCESFSSDKTSTVEAKYKIEAYLNTSVGNECKNKHISADFCWWITQSENLDSPQS